jgi:hypothetical protein
MRNQPDFSTELDYLFQIEQASRRVIPGGWIAIPTANLIDEDFLDEFRERAIYFSSADFVTTNEAGQRIFLNYFRIGHPIREMEFSLGIDMRSFSKDDAYNLFEMFSKEAKIRTEGFREYIDSNFTEIDGENIFVMGIVGEPWQYELDATKDEVTVRFYVSLSDDRFQNLSEKLTEHFMSYYCLKRKLVE